jgi:hypothetical protein
VDIGITFEKVKVKTRVGGIDQVVESLPSKHKALTSNP